MRSIVLTGAVMGMILATSGAAHAERWVVVCALVISTPVSIVNGVRLSLPEIQYLEGIRCGPIPNGSYWLDPTSGIWGYEGDPRPQGHIQDGCYRSERRPSLSERGMLFSPRDFID